MRLVRIISIGNFCHIKLNIYNIAWKLLTVYVVKILILRSIKKMGGGTKTHHIRGHTVFIMTFLKYTSYICTLGCVLTFNEISLWIILALLHKQPYVTNFILFFLDSATTDVF